MKKPHLLDANSKDGQDYIKAMTLCGLFAYAGRDWVCSKVAELLNAKIIEEVHNHHNFAWKEIHNGIEYWVIRKGLFSLPQSIRICRWFNG